MSGEQKETIAQVLSEFSDIFTDKPGLTHLVEHTVETTSDQSIRSKLYPVPYSVRGKLESEIEKMLKLCVIECSDSPYSSQSVCRF